MYILKYVNRLQNTNRLYLITFPQRLYFHFHSSTPKNNVIKTKALFFFFSDCVERMCLNWVHPMDKLAAFIVIVVVFVASWDFSSCNKAQSMANRHAPKIRKGPKSSRKNKAINNWPSTIIRVTTYQATLSRVRPSPVWTLPNETHFFFRSI